MLIDQTPAYNMFTCQMRVTQGSLPKERALEVSHLSSRGLRVSYRVSRETTLTPLDESVAAQLNHWLILHPHYLGRAIRGKNDTVAELHLIPIAQTHELDEMEFAVDEETLKKAKKLNQKLSNLDALIGWLEDQCILVPSSYMPDLTRLLASAGKELDPDLPSSYTLHGRSIRVSVVPHELPDGTRIMKVVRITRTRSQLDPDLPIRLLRGKFAFKDDSSVARVRQQADHVLKRAFEGQEMRRYLSSWDDYGQSQTTLSFEEVLEIGALTYDSYRPLEGKKVSFVLSDQPGRRMRARKLAESKNQEVAISHEPPSWIGLERVDLPELEKDASRMSESALASGRYRGMTQHEVILDVDDTDALPKKGCLYISFRGDLTVMSRRYKAQKAIRSNSTPLPYLGVLLEGLTFRIGARPASHPPMSARVERKVFPHHSPTDSQRQAIRCALNTPDIAIIQGPPGTGKTTVIEAIVERLNELYRPEDTRAGQVVITSYQHDAVENALERITINGLPSPKIGQRRARDEHIDDTERSEKEREAFSRSILEKLRAHATPEGVSGPESHRALHEARHRLQTLVEDFHRTHTTLDSARRTLDDVRTLCSLHCPGHAVSHTLRELSSCVAQRGLNEPERRELVRKVWALRTCETGHADDGPHRANDLLVALESWDGTVFDDDLVLLEDAVTHESLDQERFAELSKLRRRLMRSLHEERARDTVLEQATKGRIAYALAQTMEAIQEQTRLTMSPEQQLQIDFLRALDTEHDRFIETLLHYTIVHGATCQQIAGKYFHDAHHGELVHDAIVVDEAARANPLDLFIPMARGKKIILVGDHRQLPHIVEENILEKMLADGDADDPGHETEDEGVEDVIREHLETSLFYKLFDSLKAQERLDGIKRTITLNAQFRMHPTLGDFVGKHFYAPYREPYDSPLPASNFVHGLSRYEGQCAAWIDVPHSSGKEVSNQSKSRPVEARRIAEELAQLLEDDPQERLSFGVITFYRAQVDAIMSACRELDLEDTLVRRGVLIGTVDAFQGKEFDVVLLSMVRSSAIHPHKQLDEKDRRRTFGHLMNSNRMCVAFSRQKRLLIVAGDSAMLEHPAALEALAPLVDFYKLATCGGNHDLS